MKSRSRGGCAACLQTHKKCDEAHPSCSRCQRLAIVCDYTPHIRWFHGAQLPRKRRRELGTASEVASMTRETAGSSTGQAAAEPTSALLQDDQPCLQPSSMKTTNFHSNWSAGLNADVARHGVSEVPVTVCSDDSRGLLGDSWIPYCPGDLLTQFPSSPWGYATGTEPVSVDSSSDYSLEMNCSTAQDDADEGAVVGEVTVATPIQARAQSEAGQDGVSSTADHTMLQRTTQGDISSIFFESNDQYLAFRYFIGSVALIIPAWSGSRNGYKQVATLALSSPVLLDTLVSVSTIYMHLRGMVPQSAALRRQSKALASLRRSIDILSTASEAMAQDTACLRRDLLATILLQITVEIANGTSVIPTHLSYALQLFQGLGYDRFKPTSSVGVVLVQRMTNIDVIGSIFWQRRPLLPLDFWYFTQEEYQVDETTPTFQETTGCPLWVIAALAAISHLVADVSDGLIDEGSVLSRAMELETSLTGYGNLIFSDDASHTAGSAHLDAVCECYYWAALVVLQRRVFQDPKDSRRVQHCLARLIDLLESLPLGCGPDSQLSLPIYVAAQVAMTSEHRGFLRARCCKLSEIYPLKTRTALAAGLDNMWAASNGEAGSSCGDAGAAPDVMKEMALFIC